MLSLNKIKYRFPTNEASRSSWATYIGRNNWEPKAHATICSDHFMEKDLDRASNKVMFRKYAHPTCLKSRPKNMHTADHD